MLFFFHSVDARVPFYVRSHVTRTCMENSISNKRLIYGGSSYEVLCHKVHTKLDLSDGCADSGVWKTLSFIAHVQIVTDVSHVHNDSICSSILVRH